MAARTMRQPPFVRFMVISFLVLWLIVAAFPFLWTLWGSFKVEGDFFSKADWANALTGPLTMVETGGNSPATDTTAPGCRRHSGWRR